MPRSDREPEAFRAEDLRPLSPAERRLSAPDLSKADPDAGGRVAVYVFSLSSDPKEQGLGPEERILLDGETELRAELRAEFDVICGKLTEHGPFSSDTALRDFCRANPEAILPDGNLFAFRCDSDRFSYLFRFSPNAQPPHVSAAVYRAGVIDAYLAPFEIPGWITCVSVCPGRPAFVKKIPPELDVLKREVGGDVEVFYPFPSPDIAVLCNEEGKIRGLPLCRAVRDDDGSITDIVAGRFLICGVHDGEFVSLPERDLHTALETFFAPEEFFLSGGEIGARPIPPVPDVTPDRTGPVPLYRRTYREALERGETDACERSFRANIACRDAIEQTLSEGTNKGVLSAAGTRDILDRFGEERTSFVLANTLQKHSRDSRYSVANRAWGASVPVPDDRNAFGSDRNLYFMIDRCDARLADIFVTQTRRILAQRAHDFETGSPKESRTALSVRPARNAREEAER